MTGKATDDTDQDDADQDDDQFSDDNGDDQLANTAAKGKGKQTSKPATRAKVVVEDEDEVEDEEDEEDQNARLEVEPAEAEFIDRCIDESEEMAQKAIELGDDDLKKVSHMLTKVSLSSLSYHHHYHLIYSIPHTDVCFREEGTVFFAAQDRSG